MVGEHIVKSFDEELKRLTNAIARMGGLAESQIAGYQVFVNLNGPLTDTELLNATVRSSPALPQAENAGRLTPFVVGG